MAPPACTRPQTMSQGSWSPPQPALARLAEPRQAVPRLAVSRLALRLALAALLLSVATCSELLRGSATSASATSARTLCTRKAAPVPWFTPAPGTTFFWQLSGTVKLTNSWLVKSAVVDTDGFEITNATVAALHKSGKKAVCYFSFGSWEDYRPDSSKFPNSVKGPGLCKTQDNNGKCIEYWQGEKWLDIRSSTVRTLLEARVQLAASKGCDGIEPDNLDVYGVSPTPFNITKADSLAFLQWISATVHKYNMSVGLKNAGELAPQVVGLFDWALSEECNAYSDYSAGAWEEDKYQCDYLNLFVKAGKAAFVAEYSDFWSTSSFFPKKMCALNNAAGFTTMEYDRDLTGTYFKAADCLIHKPSGCDAKTWLNCTLPAVSALYKVSPMTDADAIGQCERAKASQYCTYNN